VQILLNIFYYRYCCKC